MAKHPDVAIIGGGIIGLTCAYFLAKEGLSVEVFDRGDLGKEASWAGAGIIPPGNPLGAATAIDRLRAIGSTRFSDFSAELRELTGIDNGYLRCSGIEFLEEDETREVLELWENEGIAFERLTRDQLRGYEPAVEDVPAAPYLLPGCAQVRNPWHLRALVTACERARVRLRPYESASEWITFGKRIKGVWLASGDSVSAGRCLLASGAWTDGLLELLGYRLGVHPVRGQIVLLNRPQPQITRILMIGKRYLVPRGDGRVLVGSTEEPEAGFEKRTTPVGVSELFGFAARLIPKWAGADVERCWAGLRPGTPDGLPFIGPVPGWDNVFVATGHFRAGVQLSIGTAQAIAELFTGKPTCVPLDAFRVDRKPNAGGAVAFRS
jgi:glycine oxidase